MSITIITTVEITSSPLREMNSAFTTKKGVFYPDSLNIKYHHVYEYQNNDGDFVDGEKKYLISIYGSSKKDGEISKDVKDLNSFLRSYDFSKKPIVLNCEIFEDGIKYSKIASGMVESDYKSTKLLISAREFLASLKK